MVQDQPDLGGDVARAPSPVRSGVWREHDFRWLATGQGLSWVGDAFQPVALAVAVLAHGGSAGDLGIPLATSMVARLLCSLAGGVWADRLTPQRIMVVVDVVRLLAAAGLALLFASGTWSVWSLSALLAVSGAAAAFFTPAMIALKPNLVPVGLRQSCNGVLTMLQTGAGVVGPMTAGAVVAVFGAPAGFTVNAVSFACSAVCVTRVRARPQREERSGFLVELRGGLAAIRSRPWLRAGIVSAGAYHLGNGVVLVLMPVVAMRSLGGAHAVGLAESAAGLGGLVGGVIAMRIRVARPLLLAWPMLTVLPLGLMSYVWPKTLPAVLLGTMLGFVALMFLDVLWETTIQAHVPPQQLARVGSWDILTSFVMIPLGNALAGPLSARFGTGTVMTVCCAYMALCALSPLLTRSTWQVSTRHTVAADPVPAPLVRPSS